jgi:hypothetical protein
MASKPRPNPTTVPSGLTKSPKARGSKDKDQAARFIETARELEVDESGKAFDHAIGRILHKVPTAPK